MIKLKVYAILACAGLLGLTPLARAIEAPPEVVDILGQYRTLKESDAPAAEKFLFAKLEGRRHPALLFEAALLKAQSHAYAAAAQLFGEILAAAPDFPGARQNRGQLLAQQGKWQAAATDLLAAIKSEGMDARSMTALGLCYQQLGKPAAAETALRWALLHQPDAADTHLALAASLLAQKRFTEAGALAAAAIRLGAKDISAWSVLANAHMGQGENGKAIEALEAARTLAPKTIDVAVLWTLGDLYLHERMTDEAVAVLRLARQRDPKRQDRLYPMVEALLALGDGRSAAPLTDDLRRAEPRSARAYYYSAVAADLNGQAKDALARAQQAAKLDSGFGRAYLLLGRLHGKAGKQALAVNALRTARAFRDLEPEALRLELELWTNARDWPAALAVLEVLQQRAPAAELESLAEALRELAGKK